jgi:hypothetical protein
MANNTYVALDNSTLLANASSVTFNSISSAYTDLVLVINAKSSSDTQIRLQFNSDTTSNYSATMLGGDGASPFTVQVSNEASMNIVGVGTISGMSTIDIINYTNTTTFKTVIGRYNSNSTSYGEAGVKIGLWRKSPEAVTSITLFPTTGNFLTGSTFSLYGILAEGVSPTTKATGGAVYSDDVYYYHVFGASGTFTPTQSITADVLVVAGGGGGSSAFAGGGGAGGLLGFNAQSLTATNYTVTIGAGGAGGANNANTTPGSTGGDSQFGALTLVKGGGGAQAYESNSPASDANGGSGGGSTYRESSRSNRDPFGTATSGQGNNGGSNNYLTATYGSGGGGGAGTVGANGNTSTDRGGNGGDGSTAYSSWGLATGTGQNVSGTVYYAGGGAGGGGSTSPNFTRGGYGGGGNSVAGSSSSTTGQAGTANTGGGGGGGSYSGGSGAGGGAGGAGVIIVRYAK